MSEADRVRKIMADAKREAALSSIKVKRVARDMARGAGGLIVVDDAGDVHAWTKDELS